MLGLILLAFAKLLIICWLKDEDEGAYSLFLTLASGARIAFADTEEPMLFTLLFNLLKLLELLP